jgi:hypothetical protein
MLCAFRFGGAKLMILIVYITSTSDERQDNILMCCKQIVMYGILNKLNIFGTNILDDFFSYFLLEQKVTTERSDLMSSFKNKQWANKNSRLSKNMMRFYAGGIISQYKA